MLDKAKEYVAAEIAALPKKDLPPVIMSEYRVDGNDVNTIRARIREFYIAAAHQVNNFNVQSGREYALAALGTVLDEDESLTTIVDGGCGVGIELCFLAKTFPERAFFGYDLSPEMIALAEERAKRNRLSNITLAIGTHDQPPIPMADFIYVLGEMGEEAKFSISPPQQLYGLIQQGVQALYDKLKPGGIRAASVEVPSLPHIEEMGITHDQLLSSISLDIAELMSDMLPLRLVPSCPEPDNTTALIFYEKPAEHDHP